MARTEHGFVKRKTSVLLKCFILLTLNEYSEFPTLRLVLPQIQGSEVNKTSSLPS